MRYVCQGSAWGKRERVAQQHAKTQAYREQLVDGIAKKRVWNLVVSGLVIHVTILGNGCGNGLGAHIPSGCPRGD